MKISEIKKNPRNPRKISKSQLQKLQESIQRDPEFMRIRPIVIDEDNMILGGNQRYTAIKKLGMKELPDEWVVRAENLTEEQRKRFVLVDNGPEGMTGEWDIDTLQVDWGMDELLDLGFDFGEDKDEEENYTRKIEAPIYKPMAISAPNVSELFDATKTIELKKNIQKAQISDEIKEFLNYAADRHIKFNFENIAEFYCHQNKEVQELMEQSALIIIDFNKAVEQGFIKLSKKIAEQFGVDYGATNEK